MNWRYWEIKISNVANPIDITNSAIFTTTGPFGIILTSNTNSVLYRTYSNLNNYTSEKLISPLDSLIQFNRGINFSFNNSSWVIDINNNLNLILRPGRFSLSTFSIKPNTSLLTPSSATLTLKDKIFVLSDKSHKIVTLMNQSLTFYIGAPCGTAPGNYLVYFQLTAIPGNANLFAPLAPLFVFLDSSKLGNVSFSAPNSVAPTGSVLVYIKLSDPNVETVSISWSAGESSKNDASANFSSLEIPPENIASGNLYDGNNNFCIFSISNPNTNLSQIFRGNPLNNCYQWVDNLITFSIFGSIAIIPSQIDQNLYFKYSNSDSDKTILEKNTIKINFLPPASPIFMYCALVCFNKNFPDDQVIKDSSNVKKNPKDNLVKYYTGFFNDLTPKDIIFDKLVRGQRYKLRCILTNTNALLNNRTSLAINMENLGNVNSTSNIISTVNPLKSQCVQYYFNSDPGVTTKNGILNHCQRIFSNQGWSSNGCFTCMESNLLSTSNSMEFAKTLTLCTNSKRKKKLRNLRFLQTSSLVVNNTLPVIPDIFYFSVCSVQNMICPTDFIVNKTYTDFFGKFFNETKTAQSLLENIKISNVPLNNTFTVTDTAAPVLSKNLNVRIITLNTNGLLKLTLSFPSAIKCYWSISMSSAAPTLASQIVECLDSRWCGGDLIVSSLIRLLATDEANLKPFSKDFSYSIYFTCLNDVSYSETFSDIFNLPLIQVNNTIKNTTSNSSGLNDTLGNATKANSGTFLNVINYFIIIGTLIILLK